MTAPSDPIDLFVICYERTPMLERCLASVREHTGDVEHRLTVVEGKRSAAENRNLALGRVQTDWFVIMDDDVVVTHGWLRELMAWRHERIGQIQPKLLHLDGSLYAAEKHYTTPWGGTTTIGTGEKDDGRFDGVREVELLSGTCCLYNAAALASCAFDTGYVGAQWEDCDFSMQLRRAGYALLYCGRTAVYHLNAFRNARNNNHVTFLRKWFGARELTRRGVLELTGTGGADTRLCRCDGTGPARLRRQLEGRCGRLRSRFGLTHVDLVGGDGPPHPDLVRLVEHASSLGLQPTLQVSSRQSLQALLPALARAGLRELLVCLHETGGERLDTAREAGLGLRVQVVADRLNVKQLPRLAEELLAVRPDRVQLAAGDPFAGPAADPVRLSEALPGLREAAELLTGAGIEVELRHVPFCLVEGLEPCVVNLPQAPFSPWGRQLGAPHRLRGEYDHLYYALRESRRHYDAGEACRGCSLRLVCGGLPREYVRVFGSEELRTRGGTLVRDPLHFHGELAAAPAVEAPLPKGAEPLDVLATYPLLRVTDPLVRHQLIPLDQCGDLSPRRDRLRLALLAATGRARALGEAWLPAPLWRPVARLGRALAGRRRPS